MHHYLIRVQRRESLRDALLARGVETAVYYPVPLHRQPALAGRLAAGSSAPNAEQMAEELLALPVHDELTEADIDRVCDALWQVHA